MTKTSRLTLATLTLTAILITCFQNCSPAGGMSSSKSPNGGSQNYNAPGGGGGTTTDNPKVTANLMIASYQSSAVLDTNLCVKEIQFGVPVSEQASVLAADIAAAQAILAQFFTSSGFAGAYASATASSSQVFKEMVARRMVEAYNKLAQAGLGATPPALELKETARQLTLQLSEELRKEIRAEIKLIKATYVVKPSSPDVNAPPAGKFVEKFEIPPDKYAVVDVVLEAGCVGGSFNLQTASGTLKTNEPLRLQFEGMLQLKGSGDIKLDMQPIVDALAGVTAPEQIPEILKTAKGRLQ